MKIENERKRSGNHAAPTISSPAGLARWRIAANAAKLPELLRKT
jgi:hypothetical protein